MASSSDSSPSDDVDTKTIFSYLFQVAYNEVIPQQAQHTARLRVIAQRIPRDDHAVSLANAALSIYDGPDEWLSAELPAHYGAAAVRDRSLKPPGLLPELWLTILDHVLDWDPVSRHTTLLSLCLSSPGLRSLAQPVLWKNPRDLDTIQRQLRFRYAVALRPDIAATVKKLSLLWNLYGVNNDLIVSILRGCSGVKSLSLQRVSRDLPVSDDWFSHHDAEAFCQMCESLPRLRSLCFRSGTDLGWCDTGEEIERRCATTFASLDHLTLEGREWLTGPSLKHISRLTSISIDTDGHHGALEQIAKRCPQLQEVSIPSPAFCPEDIIDLSHFSPNLRRLAFCGLWIEESPNISASVLPRVLPHWPLLEKLDIGIFYQTTSSCLQALASPSMASLRYLALNHIDRSSDVTEQLIVAVIRRHASTLTFLSLNYFSALYTDEVLSVCASASRLKILHLLKWPRRPGDDAPSVQYPGVDAAAIDSLLDACPKLLYISNLLRRRSATPERWLARKRILEQLKYPEWENFYREYQDEVDYDPE
ncbi:hypothetical protein P170DRAFT_487206 [Aspergillus steynii IBT 23096]|uniref:F-box domain-containing protein n=1 Tax=Aspergillus steynii IBT 23096 TaxID=1392250 RepID=A0A2I2GEW4_9EURO|nr:uncharacterized protein P170DRAFT_487206 [Aspergillus steynii IBT 23096]PLB51412.1 hypothetical protein P170DRAFT_487206 [Aspergillus steynii IBT 23096]